MFGMTAYQMLWYFLVYSFIGWVVEVVFHAVTVGKVINRGFLNGPVCPVYGFGMLAVLSLIHGVEAAGWKMNDFMLFLFGLLLATAVELVAGWLLDVCFHARWWDYSDKPFQFRGYICLEFSILWGLGTVIVIRGVHSLVEMQKLVTEPTVFGLILLNLLNLIYAVDFVVTAAVMKGFNKRLHQLDQVRAELRVVSDKLSEYVGNRSISTMELAQKGKELAVKNADKELTQLKQRAEVLQNKMEELISSASKRLPVRHLLKAFPGIKHRSYQDVIELLKKKIKNS